VAGSGTRSDSLPREQHFGSFVRSFQGPELHELELDALDGSAENRPAVLTSTRGSSIARFTCVKTLSTVSPGRMRKLITALSSQPQVRGCSLSPDSASRFK
jgi:hypothetical protein